MSRGDVDVVLQRVDIALLGKNAFDPSLKSYRAVIKMLSPKSRYADVRLHATSRKAKKISRIDAKLVARSQLNRLGRSLSVR